MSPRYSQVMVSGCFSLTAVSPACSGGEMPDRVPEQT